MRDSTAQWLSLAGFEVETAADAQAALEKLDPFQPDVLISDIRMPRMDGLELMRRALAADPELPVIMLTAHGDVPLAVAAMRQGAQDFLEKPYDPDHLVEVIRKAARTRALALELRQLKRVARAPDLESRFVGRSPSAERVRREIATLAAIDADVVITGETGCGKEVVARAIHDLSRRAANPYVAINCAAIPADIFEAELFGHEAGAFTGAKGTRIGKFEFAHGGTLLLDEIESMPLALQAKVLRVVQERTIERLGSNRSIPVDIRIIAAAKDDLARTSQSGRFRADLYYRLNVAEIHLDPLRERPGDIPLLFAHFVAGAAARQGTRPPPVKSEVVDALMGYSWPGNVRQLRTIAERFALGLPAPMLQGEPSAGPRSLSERVSAFERAVIITAIREQAGDMGRVAEVLGLPRRTLNEKMVRYAIQRRDAVETAKGEG